MTFIAAMKTITIETVSVIVAILLLPLWVLGMIPLLILEWSEWMWPYGGRQTRQ